MILRRLERRIVGMTTRQFVPFSSGLSDSFSRSRSAFRTVRRWVESGCVDIIFRVACWSVAFLMGVLPAGGGVFTSTFGFQADAPKGWLVLSREEIKNNPDLFDGVFDRLSLKDPAVVKQVKDEIQAGRIEYLFAPKAVGFRDNVTFRKVVSPTPTNAPDLKTFCDELSGAVSKATGRATKVYSCRFEGVPAGKAAVVEFDGISQGTRSIQYEIPSSPSVTLSITGTFKEDDLDAKRAVMTALVGSVHFVH